MRVDFGGRLFVAGAALGGVAVAGLAVFVALGGHSVVAGPDAAPPADPAPPNPGHSWSEIGDLPGTMWHSNNDGPGSGLDADMVDGKQASELGGWTQSDSDLYTANPNWEVGIGTTSPATKLDVAGPSLAGKGQMRITDTSGDDPFISFYDNTSTYRSYIGYSNGLAQWGTQDGSDMSIAGFGGGDVAIGSTVAPTHKLTVTSTSDRTLRLIGPDSLGHGARLNFGDSDYVYVEEDTDDHLYIQGSNGTAIMGGNVGIGTAAPEQKLHVAGIGRFDIGGGSVSLTTPGGWPGIIAYETGGHRRDIIFDSAGIRLLTSSSSSPPGAANGITISEDGSAALPVLRITGGSDLAEPFDIEETDAVKPGMVLTIDPENPGELEISQEAYDRRVAGVISGAGGMEPGLVMAQLGSVADGQYPVALTGRVYVWADAANGPIQPGDMLTTSDTPGHAMKVTDHERAQGAILGKAMSSLEAGRGLILVLVALQ